jgi:hypothetical protein
VGLGPMRPRSKCKCVVRWKHAVRKILRAAAVVIRGADAGW